MSGVEIIGLVLGALPLIISAFEHLHDAFEARDLLVHFQINYSKAFNNIKDEELEFHFHLQKLLLPFARDDKLDQDDICALMLEPGGPRWQQNDIDEALRSRLGDAYTRYIAILQQIPVILHKLLLTLRYKLSPFQEKLEALQRANSKSFTAKVRLQLQANAKFFGQNLQFAFAKASREDLLKDLQECIKKLQSFLEKSDEISTLRQQVSVVVSQKAVKSLVQHSQHAIRVYSLICQRLDCPCKQSHCAHLWLQHHSSRHFELQLLVMYAPQGYQPDTLARWQQHGLEIRRRDALQIPRPQYKVLPEKKAAHVVPQDQAEPIRSKSSGKFGRGASALSKITGNPKKPAVRFDPCASSSKTMIDVAAVVVEEHQAIVKKARFIAQPAPSTDGINDEIENFCETLSNCTMETTCVGSLTDNSDGASYEVVSQPKQKIIADEVTLQDLLQQSNRPRMPPSDRLQVALKIASSHLKLHSTPWARKQWQSKDVCFPCIGTDKKKIMFDSPYISTDFKATMATTAKAPSTTYRSFACLGIMLLELFFGLPLEEHDLWQQFGRQNTSNVLFRRLVATSWADTAEKDGGKEFASIINWCLNESPMTLEDEQWRRDLAEKVVLPLEKCCEWIQYKPSV